MKKRCFLIPCIGLLCFCALFGHAQENNMPVFINKDSSFYYHVSSGLQSHLDSFPFSLHLCEQSGFSIRFKVDEMGNIADLAFSKQASPPIKKILETIILGSNGKWMPVTINNRKVKSKYFLLYVYFSVETACKQQRYNDYFFTDSSGLSHGAYIADTSADKKQFFKTHFKPTMSDYEASRAVNSVRNMFNFDDEKKTNLLMDYYSIGTPMDYYYIGTLWFRIDV